MSKTNPIMGQASFCREGIPDAEKAKEKIKKKFGICKPDDVAKVYHVIYFDGVAKVFLMVKQRHM